MAGLSILLKLGMPIAMAFGAVMAWRMSRKEDDVTDVEKPRWTDDSLDEWRRERDAQAEADRVARAEAAGNRTGEPREETETHRQQRIGG